MQSSYIAPWRLAALITAAVLSLAPAAVVAQEEVEPAPAAVVAQDEAEPVPAAVVAQDEVEPVPWRGSSISLTNSATAISVDRAADPTYNPYWDIALTLAPRWAFDDIFSISASQSFSRELTHSDWTTREGEILLSDFGLGFNASRFVTIPGAEIGLSADLAFTFPASKISQARTLIMGVGSGLTLSRSFDVLDGLSLSYGLRGTYYWHRFTTGEYESPRLPCEGEACGEYLNTGVRNPEWRISNRFGVSLSFVEWMTLATSFALISDPLNNSADTLPVSFTPVAPTDTRFRNSFDVHVTLSPAELVAFTLGANTTGAQLLPDSSGYRSPIFNRFTVLYLDISFDLGAPFSPGS